MAAQVISLFRSLTSRDWTQAELAQFYRVESSLIQAGMAIETDRGLSDEGDPWFVFCRADDGEVFIHFARIGGEYIAVGAAMEQVVHGRDFRALVEEMLQVQSFVMARSARKNTNLFLHPAALLIALVGSAFFHSSNAKAAETQGHQGHGDGRRTLVAALAKAAAETVAFEAADNATILSAVLTADFSLDRSFAGVHTAPRAAEIAASAHALASRASEAAAHIAAAGLAATPVETAVPVHALSSSAEAAITALLSTQALAAPVPAPAALTYLVVDHLGPDSPAWVMQIAPGPAITAPAVPALSVLPVQDSNSQAVEALQAAHVLPTVQVVEASAISPAMLEAALKAVIGHGSYDIGAIIDGLQSGDPPDHTGGQIKGGQTAGGVEGGLTESGPGSPPPYDPTTSPGSAVQPPPAAGPPSLSGLAPNSPLVIAAIQHFSAEVGALDFASVAHNMVLYDGALFSANGPVPTLDSVTFTFTDGSTISLVGTPAEIQALHLFGS